MRIVCQTIVLSWTSRDGTYAGQIVATAGSFTPPGQLAIFSCQHGDNNWTSGAANMRLYSFTISNAAGEIQCNFVPCRRKSDGLVGLYDTVRETFYSNNTTSTSVNFTAGPVPGDLFRAQRHFGGGACQNRGRHGQWTQPALLIPSAPMPCLLPAVDGLKHKKGPEAANVSNRVQLSAIVPRQIRRAENVMSGCCVED